MEIIELDGVPLKFVKLTIKDEDEWKSWLRGRILADAKLDAESLGLAGPDRMDFLAIKSDRCAVGKCGILTQLGMEHAATPDGIKQILRMASRQHQPSPEIDETTLNRLLTECTDDLKRVIEYVLPGKREKKVIAGPTATPHGAPT